MIVSLVGNNALRDDYKDYSVCIYLCVPMCVY